MYGGIGLRDAMSQEFIYTFKTNTDKTDLADIYFNVNENINWSRM